MRRSGLSAAMRGAAMSLVAAVTLSACSSDTSPTVHPPSPSVDTSASAPPSPTPDADAIPPLTLAVQVASDAGADSPTLVVEPVPAGAATATSDGDTGLVVTASIPAADEDAPLVQLTVAAPAGSSVSLAPDETGAVVTSDDALVLGFAAPAVTDASGTSLAASWQLPALAPETGDLSVDLTLDSAASPSAYPLTVTLHLGTTVVTSTEWGTREGGESLAVTPSAWGRVSGQTGYSLGWSDVVRLEPTAQTSVMEKQFRCHQLGAPDKATWNLEPWRPDVSYLAYVAARCNPS